MSYQSDIPRRHAAWSRLRHTLSIISHEPANLLGAEKPEKRVFKARLVTRGTLR